MHELRNLAKTQQDAAFLSRTENHSLAEYLMRKIDYANNFSKHSRILLGDESAVVSREASRQVNHIHQRCQREIESKWQPYITDEEAHELIFQEVLGQRVEELQDDMSIDLQM